MALSGNLTSAETNSGRTLKVSWTATQSVSNNTSTISWKITGAGSDTSNSVRVREVRLTINGTQVYYHDMNATSLAYGATLASGSTSIAHNSDGTKSFTITIENASYQWAINSSTSKSFTLNTIPRASTVKATNFTLGDSCTITVTKASSGFTHTLTYQWNTKKGTIVEKSSDTSFTWTPSLEEFANLIPNKSTGTGVITCTTYNGSTKIGTSTANFTGALGSEHIPTMTSFTIEPDNSANSIIAGWGLYVAGFTKPKITASGEGIYNSTISNYVISNNSSNIATVSTDPMEWTGGILVTTGNSRYAVCCQDSRNRYSAFTDSQTITVYGYSSPLLTDFEVKRSEGAATKMAVTAQWNYSTVNGKNATTARVFYKKKSEDTWTTYESAIERGVETLLNDEFSEASSYDFRIIVTDTIGNSTEAEAFVSTIEVLLDFGAGGKKLGIGKTAELEKSVEVNSEWDFYVHGYEIKDLVNLQSTEIANEIVTGVASDFVIAQGTSGIWSYRKWNSGIAECFTTEPYYVPGDAGNMHFTKSSWADGYEPTEGYFVFPDYPFTFAYRPTVNFTFESCDSYENSGDAIMIISPENPIEGASRNYKSAPPYFKLWRGTTKTFGHPRFSCYAIGRWKKLPTESDDTSEDGG